MRPTLLDERPFEPQVCPRMQTFIARLVKQHHVDLATNGDQVLLALPGTTERLMLAGLSGHRISLSHCVADATGALSLDLDLVFRSETDFQPVELLHTDAIFRLYQQEIGEMANGYASDEVNLTSFSEYIAALLEQHGWVQHSYRVE